MGRISKKSQLFYSALIISNRGIKDNMIEDAIVKWGVVAVFLFTISNGFISTPPSELVLSIAGALTINDDRYFCLMLIGVVFSNYFGTTILFFLSRYKGKKWYDKICRGLCRIHIMDKIVPNSDSLMGFFNKQEWLIFACRFLPFIRSIISVSAGISKMNFLKFTIYSLSGITIWSLVWLNVGRAMALNIINGNGIIICMLIILFVMTGILGDFLRRRISSHKK